jgi:hypothetical protein
MVVTLAQFSLDRKSDSEDGSTFIKRITQYKSRIGLREVSSFSIVIP